MSLRDLLTASQDAYANYVEARENPDASQADVISARWASNAASDAFQAAQAADMDD